MRIGLPIFLVVAGASTAFSLPRPNSHVQSGANHHLGDRSFVAKHGTRPDSFAVERERMNLHLSFVRDWLAKRPAT
ncbi:MAG: hypothetical protein NT062_17565, partial [Proteobacteria bacterium]|nr:hypothetical protein [Pseudomonadota bacterium]